MTSRHPSHHFLTNTSSAGSTILTGLRRSGFDTSCIITIPHRTAQYVSVNDSSKNLVVAMADMDIFTTSSEPASVAQWKHALTGRPPKWVVVDANWTAQGIHAWIRNAAKVGSLVAFEPVSTVKSRRVFDSAHKLALFPHASIALATPNMLELAAMHTSAREHGHLDTTAWFDVVDAFDIRAGARAAFVRLASADLTDLGVPVQAVQLLPFIPNLVVKLGDKGVLVVRLLKVGDELLEQEGEREYIVTRGRDGNHKGVGGVYMRMYPAVKAETVVSVNGAGDTFLGVLVAELAGRETCEVRVDEELVDRAQRAAVLTLASEASVSGDIGK